MGARNYEGMLLGPHTGIDHVAITRTAEKYTNLAGERRSNSAAQSHTSTAGLERNRTALREVSKQELGNASASFSERDEPL